MKTASDSPVVQHLFIYYCLEINVNSFNIDEGTFLFAFERATIVQTAILILLYNLQLFHAFFFTKFLLFHYEIIDRTHVSILNNNMGAFKKEKHK